LRQYASASHCASLPQEVAHAGVVWSIAPLQTTLGNGPHVWLVTLAVHALSSGTSRLVPQTFAEHVATSFVPWQVAGVSHAGAVRYDAGQSAAAAQQSPPEQHRPFWQWPLEQSLGSSHSPPSGTSATHVSSQCALASHSASSVHVVGHAGAPCGSVPAQ